MAALGAAVKQLRVERDLTQERLADLADLDYTTVANLELGSGNPTLGMLFRVADALEIRLGDLATRADEIYAQANSGGSR